MGEDSYLKAKDVQQKAKIARQASQRAPERTNSLDDVFKHSIDAIQQNIQRNSRSSFGLVWNSGRCWKQQRSLCSGTSDSLRDIFIQCPTKCGVLANVLADSWPQVGIVEKIRDDFCHGVGRMLAAISLAKSYLFRCCSCCVCERTLGHRQYFVDGGRRRVIVGVIVTANDGDDVAVGKGTWEGNAGLHYLCHGAQIMKRGRNLGRLHRLGSRAEDELPVFLGRAAREERKGEERGANQRRGRGGKRYA
jgi:hypothetical protein